MRRGELDKAEEMAIKAIFQKPNEAEYYLTYSAILIKKGLPDKAIKQAQKALILNPASHSPYSFIADAFKLKKNKKAEQHFRALSLMEKSKCP